MNPAGISSLSPFFNFLCGKLHIYMKFKRTVQYTPVCFHLDIQVVHICSLFFNHWKITCRHQATSLLNISVPIRATLFKTQSGEESPLVSLPLVEEVGVPPSRTPREGAL